MRPERSNATGVAIVVIPGALMATGRGRVCLWMAMPANARVSRSSSQSCRWTVDGRIVRTAHRTSPNCQGPGSAVPRSRPRRRQPSTPQAAGRAAGTIVGGRQPAASFRSVARNLRRSSRRWAKSRWRRVRSHAAPGIERPSSGRTIRGQPPDRPLGGPADEPIDGLTGPAGSPAVPTSECCRASSRPRALTSCAASRGHGRSSRGSRAGRSRRRCSPSQRR